jgi:protein subunit release factor B
MDMQPFPVSASSLGSLRRRFEALGITDADLEETFIRSSGHGGQNVNKVSTCVVLRHVPSGVTVRCQRERTQALNRFLARRMLADVLESRQEGVRSEAQKRTWKIRKQKARRGRRAKAKMLEDKHHQTEKKSFRAPLRPGKDY